MIFPNLAYPWFKRCKNLKNHQIVPIFELSSFQIPENLISGTESVTKRDLPASKNSKIFCISKDSNFFRTRIWIMDWFHRWTFKSKLQKFIRKSLTDSLLSSKLKASTSLNEVEFDLFFYFLKLTLKGMFIYFLSITLIHRSSLHTLNFEFINYFTSFDKPDQKPYFQCKSNRQPN